MAQKKRGKTRQRMPKWIWFLPARTLNYKHKHFLAFVWWCGDRGCREWNYQLAHRFGKSDRTIKRWLKHLEDMHFIFINFKSTKRRTVYRRPYFKCQVWRLHHPDWPNNKHLIEHAQQKISQVINKPSERAKSGLHQ